MPPEQDGNNNMRTPPKKSNQNATTSTNELEDMFPKVENCIATNATNDSAPAAALDPQEIFNASIEFQSSYPSTSTSTRSDPPPRRSTEYVRSSSSRASSSGASIFRSSSSRASLYPSLDVLSQSDPSVDFERSWEAASQSSMKKRASTKMRPLSTDESSESKVASLKKSDVAETDSSSPSAARTPLSSSQTSEVASMPSEPAVACASIPSDDDDMIAAKLRAYSGSSGSGIPFFSSGNDDDDMVAMKRAAYEGGQTYMGNASSIAQLPEQQAEATWIEYDVHPSDVSVNAVQAEFIAPLPESGSTSQATISGVIERVAGRNHTGSEATIVETGPMLPEAIGEESWSAAPAAEATVLREDDMYQITDDLDCKPPARDSRHGVTQPGEPAEATIIGYGVHPADLSSEAVQAEFVGQDYPAGVGVVGVGDETMISAEASQVTDLSTSAAYQVNGNEVQDDQDDRVTEVEVIESGPMEKATAEAWSATTSGEAHVLEEAPDSHVSTFDSKPPTDASHESWRTESHSDTGEFAMMNGEAEVVEITEEVHPSELIENAAAQAELVGSDFNTAIAVPSTGEDQNGMHDSSGTLGQAGIIVESCEEDDGYQNSRIAPPSENEPQEAQATLVNEGEGYEHGGLDTTPAVAVIEQFVNSGRAVSDPLPATPVTVLEEQTPVLPPRVSFSDHVKAEPYSGRTVSAPPTAEVVQESSDTLDSQEEWTRVPSFGGESAEGTPAPIPPPVATATEVFEDTPVPPPIPSPHSVAQGSSLNPNRVKSNASSASDSSVPGLQMLSSNIARGANNVMETLFGNGLTGSRRCQALAGVDFDKMSGSVLPRTLLPSSVIYSEPTHSWVATVNTNQRALEANNVEESSKALRAFSVPTKRQATALAQAWAPPQMHPFDSNPACFVCESPFAVFRRACHCRNCGVCVCGPCSVQWPSKMLPVTYNIKRESFVNICKACNWLCSEFRLALLQGDHDKAVALHSTGNINLTTPFANVKGELFYPVHCAVLGGNLKLLKWLVDDYCCPLRSIRISNGKVKGSSGSYTPILTSKGRSLLGIALNNRNIGIVRYLVVDKRMLLSAEKGLSVETLAHNLDLVLRVLPEAVLGEQALEIGRHSTRSSIGFSDRAESMSDNAEIAAIGVDEEAMGLGDSECIICFDNSINCVFTPCGHQICCLDCGNHISRCPVCAVECSPMRVFKP